MKPIWKMLIQRRTNINHTCSTATTTTAATTNDGGSAIATSTATTEQTLQAIAVDTV